MVVETGSSYIISWFFLPDDYASKLDLIIRFFEHFFSFYSSYSPQKIGESGKPVGPNSEVFQQNK